MNQWLYRVVAVNTEYERNITDALTGRYPGAEAIEEQLKSHGEFGWELVSFLSTQHGCYAVFKQPGDAVPSPAEILNRLFPDKHTGG